MNLTELMFDAGDFTLEDVGGGVFDLRLVEDNQAIMQDVVLVVDLQKGFNGYFPEAGWNWMTWLHADLTPTAIDSIKDEIRRLVLSIDFTESARLTYLGLVDGQQVFSIEVSTAFGTENIAYALGGRNA